MFARRILQLTALLITIGVVNLSASLASTVPTYLLVVNANNRFSANEVVMKAQVKRLYLKQQLSWPDAAESLPFDRPIDNPAHHAFISQILEMTTGELDSHWLRLKQTTGETPPDAVSSVRSLLRQISRNEGAFSIIEEGETRKLPAKVRILFRFDIEQSFSADTE